MANPICRPISPQVTNAAFNYVDRYFSGWGGEWDSKINRPDIERAISNRNYAIDNKNETNIRSSDKNLRSYATDFLHLPNNEVDNFVNNYGFIVQGFKDDFNDITGDDSHLNMFIDDVKNYYSSKPCR